MNDLTIVFDLDDTLFKEIEYLKSAYHEISCLFEDKSDVLYELMIDKYLKKENVFEYLSNQYKIDIGKLLEKYRNHLPNIMLESEDLLFLKKIKTKDYKLGLITDGRSVTQRNKIKSLGLENYFDLVIISEEFGSSKPSEQNFKIFHQFETLKYIYIGDNISKDFVSPNNLGWDTYCLLDNGKNIHPQILNLENIYSPKYIINKLSEIQL